MTRPAIIIGLGGTGEWITTFVKKDLIEIGKGKLPLNVRLLTFDLTPQGEANVRGAGAAANQESKKRVQVGQIRLIKDKEFIDLGGNIHDLSEAIVQESKKDQSSSDQVLRHLATWFQASDYLSSLPQADFDLCRGAGQIRQFGRMAVFEDLTHGRQQLLVRIDRAMNDLQAEVRNANAQLEIIIIASFAGGTGAGMMIDIANLARHRAKIIIKTNYTIRGFVVLPDAFPWADDNMRTRAYAAWRELDRFMLVNKEKNIGLESIQYNRDLSVPVETWPFDALYLTGGDRKNHSLQNVKPELGVFPSVADVISAILDGVAGARFTALAANLRPLRLELGKEDTPLYSSVGSYTIKTPVYYAEQVFIHQLALKALDVLVPLQRDVQDNIVGLKPDGRLDIPDRAGASEVLGFLSNQPITVRGVSISNTLFMPAAREILGTTGAQLQQMVNDYAQYATEEGGGANAMLAAFTTNLPESLGEELEEIEYTRDVLLVDEVLPSKVHGDSTFEATGRYAMDDEGGIEPFVKKYYGYLREDGTDYRGTLGDSLEECKTSQLDIFHRRLRTWLQGTMQGDSGDPPKDLGGRLGYALSFVRALDAKLKEFEGFVEQVVHERGRLALLPNARAQEQHHWEYLVNHPKIRLIGLIEKEAWFIMPQNEVISTLTI